MMQNSFNNFYPTRSTCLTCLTCPTRPTCLTCLTYPTRPTYLTRPTCPNNHRRMSEG